MERQTQPEKNPFANAFFPPPLGSGLHGSLGGRRLAETGVDARGEARAQLHDGYSAHQEGKERREKGRKNNNRSVWLGRCRR